MPELLDGPAEADKANRAKNTENNSEVFQIDLEIAEFRPNYANFSKNQGINREFCGFRPKPQAIGCLGTLAAGFEKIAGKCQGLLISESFSAALSLLR